MVSFNALRGQNQWLQGVLHRTLLSPTTTSVRTRPLLFLPDPLAQSVVKVGFAGLRVQQSGMSNRDLGLGPTRCLVHPPVSLGG